MQCSETEEQLLPDVTTVAEKDGEAGELDVSGDSQRGLTASQGGSTSKYGLTASQGGPKVGKGWHNKPCWAQIMSDPFGSNIRIQVRVSKAPSRQHTVGDNQGPGTVTSCPGTGFQGSNCPKQQKQGLLHQPNIPGAQVRWLMVPSHQSQILKQVDCGSPLQDGIHQDSEKATDAERLASEAGPQGCVPNSPDSQFPPEILEVLLGGQGVAVPGPPHRAEQCTIHFHQGHEARNSHNETTGNQADTLPQ